MEIYLLLLIIKNLLYFIIYVNEIYIILLIFNSHFFRYTSRLACSDKLAS